MAYTILVLSKLTSNASVSAVAIPFENKTDAVMAAEQLKWQKEKLLTDSGIELTVLQLY